MTSTTDFETVSNRLLESIQQHNSSFTEEANDLFQSIQLAELQLQSLKTEVKNVEDDNKQTLETIKLQNDEINKLNVEKVRLNVRLQSKEAEIAKMKSDHDQALKKLNDEYVQGLKRTATASGQEKIKELEERFETSQKKAIQEVTDEMSIAQKMMENEIQKLN